MNTSLTAGAGRRVGRLVRAGRLALITLANALLLTLTNIQAAYAQGGGGDGGTGRVGTKIEEFATNLQNLGRPIGVLSFTLIGIAFVVAPAARRWAEEHKQMAGGVIFGLLMLTFIGDIVDFVMG